MQHPNLGDFKVAAQLYKCNFRLIFPLNHFTIVDLFRAVRMLGFNNFMSLKMTRRTYQ